MNPNSKTQPSLQTLADILQKEKDLPQVTELKISIANKTISSIGKRIPSKYCGITHLLLLNNHLSSLSGIEAFPNLTHLSIASNDIESIEELLQIVNKELIVSLSVKKNFFFKNPQANIDLIHLFPKMKYLDGFKITDSTHKVISESYSLSYQIITFAIILQHRITELNKLISIIKLNDEYKRKKINGMKSIDDIDNQINEIQTLLRLNKVKILKEEYIKKYLNKNINPSVHVLKKIMDNSCLGEERDIQCEPIKISHEEYSHCFESLFSDIISIYESKNNYNELPSYLNYMILKDNPILTKFFMQKIKQQTFDDFDSDTQSNPDKSYIESISSICKEFNSLFLYYSNYSIGVLNKYQLMYFYQINKKCDVLSGYHPRPEDMMIYFDQGNEKISMDEFNRKVLVCLASIECDSFPVFALNFDYMRCLTTVIQNRINEYKNKTDKIAYFIQLLSERKKMFIPKQKDENDLFKYHFAINNMKIIKKKDHSKIIKGSKFYHVKKTDQYIRNKSKSKSRDKDHNQHISHSSGHITQSHHNINNDFSQKRNKCYKSYSNKDKERPKSCNSPHHFNVSTNDANIIIVKPNEQFTLANNDDKLSIEETNTSILNKQGAKTPKSPSNNYYPSSKNGSDIIKQIKKENRVNNLIKRYMKYHNGFVTLDIMTRLAPMKIFITRVLLKVIKLKMPYLISAIQSYQFNEIRRQFLYDLWSNNQKYILVKHHLLLSLKRKIMKMLKQNRNISIHLKRGYYGMLLSKAIFALKQHKTNSRSQKQRYRRVTYYYYSKLIKKVWLIIKFHHHLYLQNTQKAKTLISNNDYPEGKYLNQYQDENNNDSEYAKVFNFFHKEDSENKCTDHISIDKGLSNNYYEGSSKGLSYTAFDQKKQIIEEGENEAEDNRYNNTNSIDNSNSMNQVNFLIDHLEERLNSITKANKSKPKRKREIEREKNVNDNSIKSTNIPKGRNNQSKKIAKESNETCPYCVSGIEHDKCVGQTNNTEYKLNTLLLNSSNAKTLLLGAPNFIRNTSTFIHKKLK